MMKGDYLKERVSVFHAQCRAVTDQATLTGFRVIEHVRESFQVGPDQGNKQPAQA